MRFTRFMKRVNPVERSAALVAGFDDVAVMGQAIEQGGGHFGVAEDAWPFAEAEVGGDDHRDLLIEVADQVEQELTAGLGEGEIAKLVENDEVEACESICDPALAFGPDIGLELVDAAIPAASDRNEGVLRRR